MIYLKALRSGLYDPDYDPDFNGPSPTIFDDLPYLLDADSHHHQAPCGVWCPRRDVLIAAFPDLRTEDP